MWFENKYHCVFVLTASTYIIPFFKNFSSHSYPSGRQESTLMVHFTDEKTKAQRFNLSQIGSLLLNSLTCGVHVCISVSSYVCACPSQSCVEAWVCLGVLQKYWMSKIIQHKQIISQVNKDKEYDKSEKNSSDWEIRKSSQSWGYLGCIWKKIVVAFQQRWHKEWLANTRVSEVPLTGHRLEDVHPFARTALLHHGDCGRGGGGGAGGSGPSKCGSRIFHAEFDQKLTYRKLGLSSQLCAPAASDLYQWWPVLAEWGVTQESHPTRVKGSGGLGVPSPVLHWEPLTLAIPVLDPGPTLYSKWKKKSKKVVQFESGLVCLPARESMCS